MTKLIEMLASTATGSGAVKPPFFDGGEGDGAGGGAGADAGSSSSGDGAGSTLLAGGDGENAGKKDDAGDGGSDDAGKKDDAQGDGENADDKGDKDSDDKKSDNGEDSNEGKDKTDGDDAPLTLTAPEGLEAYQGDVDQFASDMGQWSKDNPDATQQDMLNEIVDRQAKLVEEQRAEQAKETARWAKDWADKAKSDPDFGGDDFDRNVALAVKGREMVADEQLESILDQTGLGNNAGVLKAFAALGATAQEAPVIKGAGAAENLSLADALYGGK